jgi:hypothetical protein
VHDEGSTLLEDEAITLGEFNRIRNGSTPAPPAQPERLCEVCGKVLKTSQRRTCSTNCSRVLGHAASRRDYEPPSLSAWLTGLPSDVTAVELAGWRCVRAHP